MSERAAAKHRIMFHRCFVFHRGCQAMVIKMCIRDRHKIGRQHKVTVATSDGLEQIIILGQGAQRMSAKGLQKEIQDSEELLRQEWHQHRQSSRSYLFDNVSQELADYVEQVRLGNDKEK